MTQKERILKALRIAGERGVTTVDMVNGSLGEPILRGAARIEELRDEGFAIKTVKLKNRTARYVLVMSTQRESNARGSIVPCSGVSSVVVDDSEWTSEVSLFDDSELEWV
jgi:hypothetical protein